MVERPAYMQIWEELSGEKNMAFLAGPRQSGKTTLANRIARNFANHCYFNWDIENHRTEFISKPDFFSDMPRKDNSLSLVVFQSPFCGAKRMSNTQQGMTNVQVGGCDPGVRSFEPDCPNGENGQAFGAGCHGHLLGVGLS